jgi:hypothetical protein
MSDICNKCGKAINDNHNKINEEKDGELFEFHRECFDSEEFYKD